MRAWAIVIVVSMSAWSGCGGSEDSGDPDALFAGIGDDQPGCSAAVAVDGEVVFAGAYGAASLDPLVPFTTDTPVDIASTGKQFTALAVGVLVDEGVVGLDDPVADHVDGLGGWAESATIGSLLTHTSGLPDYGDLLADRGIGEFDAADQVDALAVIASSEPERSGEFEYSNSNYVLLAEVIESAAGTDFASFLDEELFTPFEVEAAVARPPDDAASSYDDELAVADSPWRQMGDGAIWTNPSDLARFASIYWEWDFLADLRARIGVDTGDGVYSMGIEETDENGRTLLSHDGSWSGFETAFVVDLDRRAVATYTCNGPYDDVDPLELLEAAS